MRKTLLFSALLISVTGRVFELDPSTGAIGTLLYQTRVGGSLGVFNSIVAANLDGVGVDELYVAGSLGLRKWVH